ncbi:MAG: PorT family protein [Candidatus Kapabacteria bacterium]|nr:PorT family protein [Ignavibacteriota bacterium]MCW5885613.1 PorT family protein [Candidatus Kapabacteria bacterium]
MRKYFIAILLIFAPLTAYSNFNAGIQIGYNTTELSTDWNEINSNLKSGFQIGIFARFGNEFFLQPELLYANRGGFAEFQNEFWENSGLRGRGTEVHAGMFQMPIMVGYKLIDGAAIGLNVQAGPVISIITDKGLAGISEVYNESSFEDYTWGVQVGAGIDIFSFTLNARYEYSLSDIYKGNYESQNFNVRAHTFLVTLGWKLL